MGRTKRKRRRKRNRHRQNGAGLQLTAAQLVEKDDHKAARDLLLTKTSLTDDDRRLLARCHFRLNEDEQAADVFSGIESKTLHDYGTHGFYLVFAKRWDEATNSLRVALSRDPDASWVR